MRLMVWILTFFAVTGLSGLSLTAPALAATCACLDNNGDDDCGPGDTPVDNDDWLKGPTVGAGGQFPGKTFVLPAVCHLTVTSAPKNGIVVDAQRIAWRGTLISTPTGGEGVLLRTKQTSPPPPAVGDPVPDILFFAGSLLSSGGINKLLDNQDNAGVAKASVGLKSAGSCIFNGSAPVAPARLIGSPDSGNGQIGIHCDGNIELHGADFSAGGIAIQSITGEIDASCASVGPCDVGDCTSFPCTRVFNTCEDIKAFCHPPASCNHLRAHNNPIVMIAKTDLRLDSPNSTARNIVEGHYRIKLVAADGYLDTDNAYITNKDLTTGQMIGGATIWTFADPASVKIWPLFKEKATGPCSADIEIEGACYESVNDIRYCGTLVGVPEPSAPCAQLPDDFVAVLVDP